MLSCLFDCQKNRRKPPFFQMIHSLLCKKVHVWMSPTCIHLCRNSDTFLDKFEMCWKCSLLAAAALWCCFDVSLVRPFNETLKWINGPKREASEREAQRSPILPLKMCTYQPPGNINVSTGFLTLFFTLTGRIWPERISILNSFIQFPHNLSGISSDNCPHTV